ncbi:MAG: nucleoside-diphosphate kinase [Acidobacteria bacterium]|nr:MAG: nucleoside-diphosphate kinase [Acidobacteriota bacterium]
MEKTFTILKPDTVKAGNIGAIISRLENGGFRIRAIKMLHLTEKQAQGFYYVHKERPFFGSLVKFMTEGPVVLMVLEAENAVEKLRKVMGATDPAKAEQGTIRKQFGTNIERNAVHGSDGPETAAFEIAYFFNQLEIAG